MAASLLRRVSSHLARLPRPLPPFASLENPFPQSPPAAAPSLPQFSFGASMELVAVPKKKVSRHKKGLRNGPKALKLDPVIVRCKSFAALYFVTLYVPGLNYFDLHNISNFAVVKPIHGVVVELSCLISTAAAGIEGAVVLPVDKRFLQWLRISMVDEICDF